MPLAIHWFRQDLRIQDNPALQALAQQEYTILPIYILDTQYAKSYSMGLASQAWLSRSLAALAQNLSQKLRYFKGDPIAILQTLIAKHSVKAIYWNRCYEPWRIARDKKIKNLLTEKGVVVKTFNGSLLKEPWETLKPDGTYYKVFTPFYRKNYLTEDLIRKPVIQKRPLTLFTGKVAGLKPDALGLFQNNPFQEKILKSWQIGEQAAENRLSDFLEMGLIGYKEKRNFPAEKHVSRLSPYLHFGEISPNQVWYRAKSLYDCADLACFCSELGWREFSYYLLYHFPQLPSENFNQKFNGFQWKQNTRALKAWQQGQTGIPIVDAGMRELQQTGYMHNRVRMIVASFLVKNLLIPWQTGEAWFWQHLVDADLASNSASWQWVAGSGADAAPYFRIFNPILQGQKFDPQGVYTKHYVPELQKLSSRYLFNPWEAPMEILKAANVILGKNYPNPIVDLKISRERALEIYKSIS